MQRQASIKPLLRSRVGFKSKSGYDGYVYTNKTSARERITSNAEPPRDED